MADYNNAMKSAMARINPDIVFITTLTLSSAVLADDLHIFKGGKPDGHIDDDASVGYLNCIIEDGSLKRFVEMPFKINLPKEDDKAGKKATLEIANLNKQIDGYAKQAVDAEAKINLIFRSYILGKEKQEISGRSFTFQLKHLTLSGNVARAEMVSEIPNLFSEKFPRETWNERDHSHLMNRAQQFEG